MGHLRWPEPVFWATSLPGFLAAQAGYLETLPNGGKPPPRASMSKSRLAELRKLYPDDVPASSPTSLSTSP